MLKKILIAVAVLVTVSIAGTAVAFTMLGNRLAEQSVVLDNEQEFVESEKPEAPLFTAYEGGFTMLVIGSDERDGTTNDRITSILNDVMLLVHVVEDQSRVSVVSIPRDLMIDFPDCEKWGASNRQINTGLAAGGVPCVVASIEKLTGMDIPHAVLVNFSSVVKITDIVGGVPVCLPSDLLHHNNGRLIAPEGDSVLKGIKALEFLRERKTIGTGGDAGRVANQQVFLRNLLLKVQKDGVLTNPITMSQMVGAALENLTVSSTLTDVNKLVSLGLMIREIGVDNIDFYSLPVKGHPTQLYRLALNEAKFEKLFTKIQSPKVKPVEGEVIVDAAPDGHQVDTEKESDAEKPVNKNSEGYYCGEGSR
jgi:LCP family protein required for cell wall assembly